MDKKLLLIKEWLCKAEHELEDAKEAYKIAKRVKEFVLNRVNLPENKADKR